MSVELKKCHVSKSEINKITNKFIPLERTPDLVISNIDGDILVLGISNEI
jgi:hypothetical protein